ncbi:segregation and condensation protein B [Micromonospora pisi]|uniref:Segregation and condensation protein B n=1 Tax=Micromonospora pisi TaxID=589240 RepID=A0A495JS16_9ACTN|nr:SMC-Scp complex subunit ScpB [Micromonospora pisi]RKR91763.1 segregation and condensation protein B [Micromonospora pisi]
MTSEERRDSPDSLADQAAAWVPPWARQVSTPAQRPAEAPGESTESTAPVDSVESAPADEPVDADRTDDPAPPIEVDPPAGVDRAAPSAGVDEADEVPGANEAHEVPGANEAHEVDKVDEVVGAFEPPVAPTGPMLAAPVEPPAVPAEEPARLALVDDDELRAALEAILLVVDEPVAEIVLAQVLEQPTDRVADMLERIADGYTSAGHGFDLRRAAGGWRLYTRPEYATYVERFVLNGQAVRLTQAALETLAVVAYKQPVTRSRISAIRGVNCDGVIRTLVTRGLVEECGSEPDSGAFLYRTTTLFLEKLGLNTVDELPPLAPFLPDDLEEIADAPR